MMQLPEQAEADLSEVIRIRPDAANAYFLRAGCRFDLGRYEEAIQDASETIRRNPKWPMRVFSTVTDYS